MADSVTGVPVFTLAELGTAGAGANQIGGVLETTVLGSNVVATSVVRDRWNQVAVVAVADHPADGGDAGERAIFVSNSLGNVWRLAGAKLGGATVTTAVDGVDIVIPQ